MKNLLALLTTVMLTISSAYAGLAVNSVDSAGFSKLTEQQKTEILANVAAQAAANDAGITTMTDGVTVDKLSQWASKGAEIGKGFAAAAKELGVAVTDFANTPIGKMTFVIIVWKVMAGEIVHIVGGFLFLGIGLFSIKKAFSSMQKIQRDYNLEAKNIFGNHPLKAETIFPLDSDATGWKVALTVIMWLASIAIVLTF